MLIKHAAGTNLKPLPRLFSANIVIAGFDYKHSLLEVREKVSFTTGRLNIAYDRIKKGGIINEAVILSTCNRTEIYACCDNPGFGIEYLKKLYSEIFGISKEELNRNISVRKGLKAVKHCFRVTGGLESVVIGEDQILGQVKTAYEKAVESQSSGKVLNRLFLDSITAAKKIKTQTGISSGSLSVASVGIKLLEQEMGSLSDKKALIIGLGKMNQITHRILTGKNLEKICIISRNSPGINFKDRYEHIDKVDFIVSCTSAPHLIMDKENFLRHYSGNKSLYILDLAFPRDIDPGIENIAGVQLFKIDDLERITQENYEKRLSYIDDSELIINEGLNKYLLWIKKLGSGSIVTDN